jgi:hypothetical protein
MVTARLFDRPPSEENSEGLGDYEFEVLPRCGEIIELHLRGESSVYEVAQLIYIFRDHTKPPLIAVVMRPGHFGGYLPPGRR